MLRKAGTSCFLLKWLATPIVTDIFAVITPWNIYDAL